MAKVNSIPQGGAQGNTDSPSRASTPPNQEGPAYADQRQQMVQRQLVSRGITDARVLNAMLTVPRHCFVPASEVTCAYRDEPLPTSHGQTISQP